MQIHCLFSISQYSVRTRENTDQNNSECKQFLRSDNYEKNYIIANKFQLKPRWHVNCFDYKKELRSFKFNNDAILPRFDYGDEIYVEITYICEEPWAILTLRSSAKPSFDFVPKKL